MTPFIIPSRNLIKNVATRRICFHNRPPTPQKFPFYDHMKQKLSLLITAAVLTAASQASAQGLLSVGHNSAQDFERKMPFTWTIGAQVGWDSNVTMSPNNEQDSAYL